jgi:hypothetical protein
MKRKLAYVVGLMVLVGALCRAETVEIEQARLAYALALIEIADSRPSLPDKPPNIQYSAAPVPAEASPTPFAEVDRVIALMPAPQVGFVECGCGADARWAVAAARKWKCKAVGIEIDPTRAALARERVKADGLDDLVTIVQGDATTTDVQADCGAAYLFAQTLTSLKPKIEKLRSFASYMHQPPGLPVVKNGDTWIWTKSAVVATRPLATWNGVAYSQPVCNNPRCQMCVSIRSQLAAQPVVQQPQKAASGHWVKRCNGVQCWCEWVAD